MGISWVVSRYSVSKQHQHFVEHAAQGLSLLNTARMGDSRSETLLLICRSDKGHEGSGSRSKTQHQGWMTCACTSQFSRSWELADQRCHPPNLCPSAPLLSTSCLQSWEDYLSWTIGDWRLEIADCRLGN